MNTSNKKAFVYLLIDNGLLQEVSAAYAETEPSNRPTWLAPIYTDDALSVSPLLIDLEAAYEASALDQVMAFLNALRPALHVSIIESELGLKQIAQHLRRFIFILDPEGKQFTFRYADCTVLALLPSVLTPSQWATVTVPIIRWMVHDRSGSLVPLDKSDSISNQQTPFCLSREQLGVLDEASEPDHYIAKVKMMRNRETLPGSSFEQHHWSTSAREIWRSVDNRNSYLLILLTDAAIMTRGKILFEPELRSLLENHTSSEVAESIKAHADRLA